MLLTGDLSVPDVARGLVIFAHGSGSSRKSPRNQFVAKALNQAGLGTLLFDLLNVEEEEKDRYSGRYRFDIDLLASRLGNAVEWARGNPTCSALKLGLFGASTGAAAALRVAADKPEDIAAVVSRGGRPDLAGDHLARVFAPTLLIVGKDDPEVLQLNEAAAQKIPAEKRLVVIPGATHLFEEPGTLAQVTEHAVRWFLFFLSQETAKEQFPDLLCKSE